MKNKILIGSMFCVLVVMGCIVLYILNENRTLSNIYSECNDTISENVAKNYTMDDVSEKVYGKDGVPVHLILWNDGSFEYNNEITNENGIGVYNVFEEKIYLNFLLVKSENIQNRFVASSLKKTFNIISNNVFSELEIQDGDINLVSLNQPARSGEEFYTSLELIINNYLEYINNN